ncbi:hypothetical protein ACIP43_02685 [Streptomyces albogriseolus]|uniref:hypothetical protein n=1 Tax=Streptomyces albogriseolus TaxID=1887 RepID=UPI0037F2683E
MPLNRAGTARRRPVGDDGALTVAPAAAEASAQVTDQFSVALGGRTTLLAATG